jgi:class 3 adenylate cyclase
VILPLLVASGIEGWFGYRDQRARINDILGAEARVAATKISNFIEDLKDQIAWMVHLPWSDTADDRHRIDASRLIRQVPAVSTLMLVDGAGKERLYVSRVGLNRIESGADRSEEPMIKGARAARVWYGPVTFHRNSEPFMTIAVSGARQVFGAAAAEINLKLILDVVSAIRVGETGRAFVLDQAGRTVAHPDMSLVLRGTDQVAAGPLQRLRAAVLEQTGTAATGYDPTGRLVVAARASVPGTGWDVIVHQPAGEAFGPIYAAALRMLGVLLAGTVFAAVLAYWLAARMSEPIRVLETGVQRIGAGQFDHRIEILSTDELGRLAAQVNEMASELAVSQERSIRINRLKRFLAPQIAELVDRAGEDEFLDAQRAEIVVVFADLRGFTAFSAHTEPDTIMTVLREYHEALGKVIASHGATLVSLTGDGMMVLLNAPVPCPDPAMKAVEMAQQMRSAARRLIDGWHSQGHTLGFGMGVAMGPATVGRIGSESRLDYTATGSVVNLASRLCSSASDGQILIDARVAEAVAGAASTRCLGRKPLKGFDEEVSVFLI